jgi:hypothetical protein
MLVHGSVHVAPHTGDFDVGLVDEPPVTGRVPGEASGVGEQRREPLHPPVDGDVIDLHTAFGQQLFDVPVGQTVAQVPAHRHGDDFGREPETGEGRTSSRRPM